MDIKYRSKTTTLEQILVLFNPTLDIRTSNNIIDWSALSHVEMTSTNGLAEVLDPSIDDIIDVSTLSFDIPVYINPPAKRQRLIHTVINELYSLTDEDLEDFKENF